MFEPISVYGNYFVGVDGEGVGDDYVLLDSSLSDYPRLYTGRRLTTIECLDWLWQLGKHAGYAQFCLFGAGYDYNNWMRDIPFDDVKRLADAQVVRVGDYLVQWIPHFRFELRRIKDEDSSKPEYSQQRYRYDRIRTRLGSSRQDFFGLVFWDVLPWWQCNFEKALDMTLPDRAFDRELIKEGKDARGTFTHDNIEWVSRYNQAECQNLAYMMVELDGWLKQVGIRPAHYNGPGSAAKALLRTYEPWRHAGRRIIQTTEYHASKKVAGYRFPGGDTDHAMIQRALSAYAGALNKQLKIGYHPGVAYQADIISAYPHVMRNLPCLSHGTWERTSTFEPQSFGLWKIRYRATRRMSCYPFFWRTSTGSIEYPHSFDERWCHTSEVAAGLAVDGNGITLLDGWVWRSDICDNPYPFWWVTPIFKERQRYKREGNKGAVNGLKYPLNSLYGSIAQARGGTVSTPPWSQQLLWAGAITAETRTRLYLAYLTNPESVVHMATDGIISLERLPLDYGEELGQWELTELTDLTVVQYGVYVAREKHRERGFTLKDNEVPEFIKRVHDMWATGHWQSLTIHQKIFVTCGLVAQSEKRYEEWCHWLDMEKVIELDQASIFKMGHVAGMPGMFPVVDASHNVRRLPASKPYSPKWGKGENFPREWRVADEWAEVTEVTA